MMKIYIAYILLIICLFATCKKQSEITLEADEFYVVAYYFAFPIIEDGDAPDSWVYRVEGFTEIKKDFSAESVKWKIYNSDYYRQEINLSDSLKIFINNVIRSYPNDSVFESSEEEIGSFIYDGPTYAILIKKDKKYICLSGIPRSYSADLKQIIYGVYGEINWENSLIINNQDSIRNRMNLFRKHVSEPDIPLPIRPAIKFIPPIIKE